MSKITNEDFESCLNDTFTVKSEDENEQQLELIEIKPLGEHDPDAKIRQPFSLLFRGPREPMLQQQAYQLENSNLGEMLLFLVPIGPDEKGMLYESVFN
ncbi:MAG: hypothetical protein OEN02_18930 [Gammaproteobacteria bacterium]|nr:hypothetical protein [Gammaproteobacteria bacterium]